MIKVIPNRTIGLQKKAIEDSSYEHDCTVCLGKGSYTIQLPSGAVRNMKTKIATMDVDCDRCDHGKIHKKLRVIRKGNISAIV